MKVEEKKYPSGQIYREISQNDIVFGSYNVLGDGKFLPFGCKKPISEKEAQEKVLRRFMYEHLEKYEIAHEVFDELCA